MFDIIIIFNTAFLDEDENIVQDRCKIAYEYLCGWFILDSVAILPFNAIIGLFQSQKGEVNNDLIRVAKFGRLYKLVKLTKLLRILKMAKDKGKMLRVMTNMREMMKIGVGFERLFLFIMSTLMFCHIITCLWVFVATSSKKSAEGEEDLPNWITEGDH